jgi:S-adenosylmethionine/arginine decarboxylase-like enzyme
MCVSSPTRLQVRKPKRLKVQHVPNTTSAPRKQRKLTIIFTVSIVRNLWRQGFARRGLVHRDLHFAMTAPVGWFGDPSSIDGVLATRSSKDSNKIRLSLNTLLGTVLFASTLAFLVGHASVLCLIQTRRLNDNGDPSTGLPHTRARHVERTYVQLHTQYDTSAESGNESDPRRRVGDEDTPYSSLTIALEKDQKDSADPLPVGQYLSVDLKGVDGVFLNSEERLTAAVMSLFEATHLSMLSLRCHRINHVDLSCVGLLLEGHFSFYALPVLGTLSFDLFIGEDDSLLTGVFPEIERHFSIPRSPVIAGDMAEKPFLKWAQKQRGFEKIKGNPEEAMDLHQTVLGYMQFDMKQLVVSKQTDYQTIHVYDLIFPKSGSLRSYRKSLAHDDTYEAKHPELYRPDRVIYLDGIMQSRFYGESAYHEALVHPAMFTHENPKRVAIIGGGEGATLREVLKHKTVETATMIDIDEVMVNVSREHIPEWSDCRKLIGSAQSCFDDPRADVLYTDAIAWFIDRYAHTEAVDPQKKYDVIIMDAL